MGLLGAAGCAPSLSEPDVGPASVPLEAGADGAAGSRAAFAAATAEEVEQFRIGYLGKKGHITKLFADFRNVPNQEKKEYGQLLNQLKTEALAKVKALQTELSG